MAMRLTLAFAMFLNVLACGKKEDDDKYGKVSVAFSNKNSALTATGTPSSFAAKLKYIILVEDRENATAESGYNGNNIGQGAKIWASPQCSSLTVDAATGAQYGDIKSDADCAAAGVEYFDLARTSSAVNTELNSQDAKILPGTYRYLGLALLGEQQGRNNTYENTRWAHTDSSTAERNFASVQTEWSAKFDPPLTIGEEESFVVTLSYSLENLVTTSLTNANVKTKEGGTNQPGAYDDCNTEKTVCLTFPALTVSGAKK